MKKKLENAKGLWPELLPKVLWAHHTTPKTSTKETLYSLAYGTDAVIPIEVGEPSLRYSHESGPTNDNSRMQGLDEVEEQRDMAYIRIIAQKQQVERYYKKKSKVVPDCRTSTVFPCSPGGRLIAELEPWAPDCQNFNCSSETASFEPNYIKTNKTKEIFLPQFGVGRIYEC
ncbi:uncharacterized protein [Nicotiana sylvestris]|uniref:uncharacterized protein n=1 Tax=Nicotiana sylvestris TaxID=4096 RepID=UPI00388CB5AC